DAAEQAAEDVAPEQPRQGAGDTHAERAVPHAGHVEQGVGDGLRGLAQLVHLTLLLCERIGLTLRRGFGCEHPSDELINLPWIGRESSLAELLKYLELGAQAGRSLFGHAKGLRLHF